MNEKARKALAIAICKACGEKPEHSGDCRGNEYRWQDYLDVADEAIAALAKQKVLTLSELIDSFRNFPGEFEIFGEVKAKSRAAVQSMTEEAQKLGLYDDDAMQKAKPAAIVREDTGRKWAELMQDMPPGSLLYAKPHPDHIADASKLVGQAAPQSEREPLNREQKRAMWVAATIELPSPENCYLRGIVDGERAHGICKEGK